MDRLIPERTRLAAHAPIYLLLLQSVGVSRYASEKLSLVLHPALVTSANIRVALILSALALLFLAKPAMPRIPPFILAYVAIAAMSTLWSVARGNSAANALLLCTMTFAYAYAANLYPLRRIFICLRNLLTLCIVFGLLVYFSGDRSAQTVDVLSANPFGRHGITGVFEHNVFAGVLALFNAILLWFYRFETRVLTVSALAASLLFLALSDSVTALLLALVAIPLIPMWRLALGTRRDRLLALGLASLLVAALAIAAINLPALSLALDRGADLSGRGPIWLSGLRLWLERPVSGWGYASIFGEGGAVSVLGVAVGRAHWIPPHFHNDFLQALVETGLAGFLAFTAAVFASFRTSGMAAKERQILVVLMSLLVLFSLTGEIFAAQKFGWALLVLGSSARRSESTAHESASATPSANASAIRSTE